MGLERNDLVKHSTSYSMLLPSSTSQAGMRSKIPPTTETIKDELEPLSRPVQASVLADSHIQ